MWLILLYPLDDRKGADEKNFDHVKARPECYSESVFPIDKINLYYNPISIYVYRQCYFIFHYVKCHFVYA